MRTVTVSGTAEGRFEPVADVFARVVAGLDGTGAALAVHAGGELVVDLVGGAYAPDALQLLFSVSKAVTAVAVGTLVEAGELDLDRPLAACWPELDRPATAALTLRTVMAHRAGIPGLTAPVTFDELRAGRDIDLVAREEPLWAPGGDHGYHAFTFGSLVDGALRRLLGRSAADVVRDAVAAPLGLDLWLGTPAEVAPRIAPVVFGEPLLTPATAAHDAPPDTAFGALFAVDDAFNSPGLLGASWPALSGVADARSLARMMAATLGPVDGHRYFGAAVRDDLARTRSRGPDRSLGVPTHFGTGFQLPFPAFPMLGPASYGHEAAGGSVVMADPELDIALAFTTNAFGHLPGASTEALALVPAVRLCATAAPYRQEVRV